LATTRITDPKDGSGPFAWSYNSAGAPGYSTTVTDPEGNDTRHIFSSIQPTAESQFETQVLSYQGSVAGGTLLKTVKTDYQSQLAPVQVGGANVVSYAVPIRWTTTWAEPDNRVTKHERDWDYGFTYQIGSNIYDSIFAQPIADRDYDYGQGAPGPLLRTVAHSYMNPTQRLPERQSARSGALPHRLRQRGQPGGANPERL